jgi:hypothetical protein
MNGIGVRALVGDASPPFEAVLALASLILVVAAAAS